MTDIVDYSAAPYPVRDNLVLAHQDAWARLAKPGTWWDGAMRVAIAAETRAAQDCALCRERKDALSVFAAQHMVPANAACFGLLAEATGPDGEDLMVVVYGARRRGSHVIAAMFDEDGVLTEFTPSEPLEKTAMPFVQPLQHAADMAEAPDDPAAGGLPIITTS